MIEKYLLSGNCIIKLNLEKNLYKKIMDNSFLKSYIPSVKILTNYKSIYDAMITFRSDKLNSYCIDYPKAYYNYETENIKDIISFIEYIFERCRQEKGVICIHGAGAIINNKAIVSFGTTTGMGKTTLALELSKNNYFYSDEKILIDLNSKKAIGRIASQYISNEYWRKCCGDKEYLTLKNLANDIPYSIIMFIQPLLCDQQEYTYDEWDEKKFLWHLYEESSRKIRGTSRIFFDNTVPAISLDTIELSKKRLELLKVFTKEIKSVYYKGNVDNIITKITNYIL